MEQFLYKTSPKDYTNHLSKMQFRILKSSIIEMSQTINQLWGFGSVSVGWP